MGPIRRAGHAGTPDFVGYQDAEASGRASGVQVFQVESVEGVVGSDGGRRQALRVAFNGSVDGVYEDRFSILPEPVTFYRYDAARTVRIQSHATPSYTPPPPAEECDGNEPQDAHQLLMVGTGATSQAENEYVDLETRRVLREDQELSAETAFFEPCADGNVRPLPQGSATTGARTRWVDGEPELDALRWQGRTLRLGEELTAPTGLRSWGGWTVGPARPLQAHDWRFTAAAIEPDAVRWSAEVASIRIREWVAERAVVNGFDAYDVRQEVEVRYRGPDGGPWQTWRSRVDSWMNGTVPYPVLVQSNRYDRSLATYESGAEPIPWGEANPEPGRRPAPAPGPFPRSGDDASFPWPLEEAARLAEAQPPAAYTQWASSHADARLTGVLGTIEGAEPVWRLLYSTPGGAAYELWARPGRVEDRGPHPAPRFELFPDRSISFSDAERRWRSMDPDAGGVTYMAWGFDAWFRPDPSGCEEPHAESRWIAQNEHRVGASPGWRDARDPFSVLRVGAETAEPCSDGQPLRIRSSITTVDVSTGDFVEHEISHARFEAPTLDDAPDDEVTIMHAGITFRPPTIEGTGTAAAPLFVLFLIAYMAPVLKFAGAQGLLLLPAYSKLERSRLLDQRVRDVLMRLIEAEPGLSATELQTRAELGWGTTVYHLTTLERAGLVSSLVDGRHRRFFPVGTLDWSERGQVAVLRNPRTRALLEAIEAEPGVIQERLVAASAVSRPSAIWHLRRLEEVGLVGRVRAGRKVHYYANQPAPAHDPYDPRDAVDVA